MNNLIVHDYNGFSIPQRHTDGYVSLTKMAAPFSKKVNDYLRLKSTTEYLNALQSDTGILVSDLIIVIKGNYSNGYEQGTWGHKLVAVDFARWLNPTFSVWANHHILDLVETGSTFLINNLNNDKYLIDNIANALDKVFDNLNIDENLIAGVKLNAIQSAVPTLAAHIEPARQILINSTATDTELLTPTQLGQLLTPTLSARKVNERLLQKGYQIKNPRKKSQRDMTYTPTPLGEEYSKIVLATGKTKDDTYQQLRWYDSIAPLI